MINYICNQQKTFVLTLRGLYERNFLNSNDNSNKTIRILLEFCEYAAIGATSVFLLFSMIDG